LVEGNSDILSYAETSQKQAIRGLDL